MNDNTLSVRVVNDALTLAFVLIGTLSFIVAWESSQRHEHKWVDSRLDMVPIHEKMMPEAEPRVLMCSDCGVLKLSDDYVRSWRAER